MLWQLQGLAAAGVALVTQGCFGANSSSSSARLAGLAGADQGETDVNTLRQVSVVNHSVQQQPRRPSWHDSGGCVRRCSLCCIRACTVRRCAHIPHELQGNWREHLQTVSTQFPGAPCAMVCTRCDATAVVAHITEKADPAACRRPGTGVQTHEAGVSTMHCW